MNVLILAAGRGERMRPLTDHTPKPLLQAGGKSLIEHHLAALRTAGINRVVINHAWLGQQIEATLGDGSRHGLAIRYSPEPHGALETAGGIRHALPLLGDEPFWVINGDVYCQPDWRTLFQTTSAPDGTATLAHLLLVPNPGHHPEGDFGLTPDGYATLKHPDRPAYTYSGIGYYHPALFAPLPDHTPAPLAPLLRSAIAQGQIRATLYPGEWHDIGTPARLQALDARLSSQQV